MTLEERAEEIAEFLDITQSMAMNRMLQGSMRARKLWDKANPKTEWERRKWYQETDAYIFESSYWYESDHNIQKLHKWLIEFCRTQGGRILDFGAGIAELIIQLTPHDNILPVYMDINSKTSDFAKFRLKKRGILDKVEFVTTKGEPALTGLYTVVYTLDTLEHLQNPLRYVFRFIHNISVQGKLILEFSRDFTDNYPMHLPRWQSDLQNRHPLIEDYGTMKWLDALPYGYPGGIYIKREPDVHS